MNLFHSKYILAKVALLSLLFCSIRVVGQNDNYVNGFYPVINYPAEVYKGLPPNWSVLQDKRGVIYMANLGGGIFEFDGTNWDEIKSENSTIPTRSLSIDNQGRIYIGGIGDFGFLKPDSLGRLVYHSLLRLVKEEDKQFGDVWNTFVLKGKIYFHTIDKLFVYSNDSLQVFHASTEFYYSFLVNSELFIFQKNIGLMRFRNDSLILLKGSELFIKDDIYALMPYQDNILLAVTSKRGIFLVSF